MGKKPQPAVASKKKEFQFDKSDEEAESASYRDPEEEEEVPTEKGFDLRGKSLVNTLKKTHEPKKVSLPLKAIMSGILAKTPLPIGGSNTADAKQLPEVRCSNQETSSLLQEETDSEEGAEGKEKREARRDQVVPQAQVRQRRQGAPELLERARVRAEPQDGRHRRQ